LSDFSVNQASVPTLWFDSDGRVLRVNRAGCQMLGYAEPELIGKRFADLCPDAAETIWPEPGTRLPAGGTGALEATLQRRDGVVFPVELDVNHVTFEGRDY
ncbi:MAG TPA: PAS domain-containing protein, partial [Anaerolineales bacterium]|nr:PAS domain-containing protein [Anaerolineales bacterium]